MQERAKFFPGLAIALPVFVGCLLHGAARRGGCRAATRCPTERRRTFLPAWRTGVLGYCERCRRRAGGARIMP